MKNVFFIVIDSFFADKLGDAHYGPTQTPFLDDLCKKSIVCRNMYSQGPHTEAGSRALLTGFDSLDYGGYMHNLHEAESTYLDLFKKAGYTTFDFFLPYYMYSTREFDNIDYTYFTSDFLFDSVWAHRLEHFAEIMKNRPLTELEMHDVIKQLELTFIAWNNYFEKWNDKEQYSFKCIDKWCEKYDWSSYYSLFNKEYNEFKESPKSYSLKVLEEGESCNLYKIKRFDFSDVLSVDFLNKNVFEKNKRVLDKIERKQFWLNLRNQQFQFKKILSSTIDTIKNRELSGYLRSVVYTLCNGKFAKGYLPGQFYQTLPSIRKILRTAIEEVKEKKTEAPIMVHCHPEELHNRFNYFSFDVNDEKLIEKEFRMFDEYINHLSKNYKGNIVYDCALLYVDDCIKEFFKELEENSLLNNSIVVICADHGSSYTCNTIRESVVNNCHTENFHIPLIIYDGTNPKGFENNKYHTSKDILATICNLCDIKQPSCVTGQTITEDSGSDVAVSEFIDSGCPDLRTRPIIFVARNSNYLIHYRVNAFECFENGVLLEVYDLKKDPLEQKNIKDKVEISIIAPLLDALRERQKSISTTYIKLHPDFDYSLYI